MSTDNIMTIEDIENKLKKLQEAVETIKGNEWDDPQQDLSDSNILLSDGQIKYHLTHSSLIDYWERGRLGSEEYLKDYDRKEKARATIMRYRDYLDAVPKNTNWGTELHYYYYDRNSESLKCNSHITMLDAGVIYFSKRLYIEDLPPVVRDAYLILLDNPEESLDGQ